MLEAFLFSYWCLEQSCLINKIAGDLLKTMTGAFIITVPLFCSCYVAEIEREDCLV